MKFAASHPSKRRFLRAWNFLMTMSKRSTSWPSSIDRSSLIDETMLPLLFRTTRTLDPHLEYTNTVGGCSTEETRNALSAFNLELHVWFTPCAIGLTKKDVELKHLTCPPRIIDHRRRRSDMITVHYRCSDGDLMLILPSSSKTLR